MKKYCRLRQRSFTGRSPTHEKIIDFVIRNKKWQTQEKASETILDGVWEVWPLLWLVAPKASGQSHNLTFPISPTFIVIQYWIWGSLLNLRLILLVTWSLISIVLKRRKAWWYIKVRLWFGLVISFFSCHLNCYALANWQF